MRLAAFTVHIKPRLSANGRVPFLRVYRSRGNPPLGGIGGYEPCFHIKPRLFECKSCHSCVSTDAVGILL